MKIKLKTRKKIFDIIQIGDKTNFASRAFDVFIVVVILLNIVSMFMQTFDQFANILSVLKFIEVATTIIFCIEYALRIWTAEFLYPDDSKAKARLKFLVSTEGIVDLCTILPLFFLNGFVVLRMLRVVRIFHLFRINNQLDSFNIIAQVLVSKRNQLISSIFIIVIIMMASSLCMYSAENQAQPEVFKNAFSGIWWSVSTILTVGYGDIYPVTALGRLMAIIISFLGVGVVAIPTGIISAGFVEQYNKRNEDVMDINHIGEVLVDKNSKFIGKSIGDITGTYSTSIYLIMRNGLSIIPNQSIVIEENDILIIHSNNLKKKA